MGGARDDEVFGCFEEVLQGCANESCEHELQGGRSGKSDRKERASSWRGRWQLYATLVFLFFSFCVFPSNALAYVDYNEMGISWGPNVVDNHAGEYGVIVVTDNIYNCALITLGYSPLDTRLTHDVMAKLSNASTGGAFYTFAQRVHKYYNGTFDYPSWGNWGTFDVQANVYGREYIYWVQYTQAQYASAKEDLEAILNGNDIGGGGGGSADYYDLTFDVYYAPNSSDYRKYNINNTSYYYNNDVNLTPKLGSPVTVRLTASFYNRITSHANYIIGLYSNSSRPALYILFADDTDLKSFPDVAWSSDNPNVVLDVGYKFFHFTKSSTSDYINCFEYILPLSVASGYSNDAPVFYSDVEDASFTRRTTSGWSNNPVISLFDGAGAPSLPETNWPDAPSVPAPTAPEVPEPSDPVVEDEPSSTFPVYVDVSTTDYTVDLQGVLDAMDDHCIHLQNAIWWGFNQLWNKLYQRIDWSVGVVREEFSSTRDYLHDLFGWLAEQFGYTVSGGAYNDSTVVSWLKRIYAALGLGVNTKPTDPVADPDGIGDWLGQLFANFVAWLLGFGAGLVAGLADDFATLTTKFPFSVPWDIGAMLALIVAEPQAPSFVYPIFTIDASGELLQTGTLEVDLSDFDSYMVGIRFMQKLLFCMYLAWRTPQIKDLLRIGRSR